MSDEQTPKATPDFAMLELEQFAGSGVQSNGDTVSVAFTTKQGRSIDVTMTKEQAQHLSARLAEAAA